MFQLAEYGAMVSSAPKLSAVVQELHAGNTHAVHSVCIDYNLPETVAKFVGLVDIHGR